jgi:hypothetical protein
MILFWSSLFTPVLGNDSETHIDTSVLLRSPPSFIVLMRGSVSKEPAGPFKDILREKLHEALGWEGWSIVGASRETMSGN